MELASLAKREKQFIEKDNDEMQGLKRTLPTDEQYRFVNKFHRNRAK